jgi:hypothetical protein
MKPHPKLLTALTATVLLALPVANASAGRLSLLNVMTLGPRDAE